MKNGRQVGPITWDELQDLARCGKLAAVDLVLREGGKNWQAAQTARDVEDAPQTQATAASPPSSASFRAQPPAAAGQDDFEDAAAPASGLRPGRMIGGAILCAGGIIGTWAGHNAAVAHGGGRYVIFYGPIIWGAWLFLNSFGR
jgi:hypothetical protein